MTTDTHISERERQILRLIATGATNQQIALELSISVNTVKVHLRNIFAKIGAVSRAEAVMFAVRSGIVRVDEVEDTEIRPTGDSAPATEMPDDKNVSHVETGDLPTPTPLATSEPETGPSRLALPDVGTAANPTPTTRRPFSRRTILVGGGLVLGGAVFATAAGALLRPNPTPVPTVISSPSPPRRWRELSPLPSGLAGFALASAAFDGRVFLLAIAGEADSGVTGQVARYDLGSDLWVPMSAKPTPVSDVRAATIGALIYVPGGRTAAGTVTNVMETYDPQRDLWSVSAPLPGPRAAYAVAAVEGKLYVIGGWDGADYQADVWQYNPDDATWRVRTPMPTARAHAASGVVDQQIYVVGGLSGSGKLTVNERYFPSVDRAGAEPWSTRAPIAPGPIDHSDAASVGGLVMLVGTEGTVGQLLVYNPQSDAWVSSQIPRPELRDSRSGAIGGKLYLVGGTTESGRSRQAFEYQAVSSVFLPAVP